MVPAKLEGDWVKPLCAYMYMSSRISGHDSKHPGILKRSWKDSELSRFAYLPPEVSREVHEAVPSISTSYSSNETCKRAQNSKLDVTSRLYDSAKNSKFGFFVPSTSNQNANGTSKRDLNQTENSQYLLNASAEQFLRWQLAAEAIYTHPAIRESFTIHNIPSSPGKPSYQIHEPLIEQLLSNSAGNWPGEDLLRSTGGLIMGMTLWLASIAFGAVHAAAWYDYFPTLFEQWMWRASAVYIAFSGLLWLCINGLARASKPVDAFWDRFLAMKAHWGTYALIGSLCTVCGVAYVVARIYLVVEAFISIRRLPVGAYGTPDWTAVVPHL